MTAQILDGRAVSAALLERVRLEVSEFVDEHGRDLGARVSVTDSRERAYAPDQAWIHADDMVVRERQTFEARYFHSAGRSRLSVPLDALKIAVSHGPAYTVAHIEEDPRRSGWTGERTVKLAPLPVARGIPPMWSGDLHVHMN